MAQYTDEQLERDVRAAGKTAPRITAEHLESLVTDEQFYRFPGTTVTVACLVLQNGFCTIGHSASASPENFDAEIGKRLARQDALDKMWALEGYLLRQRLFEQQA